MTGRFWAFRSDEYGENHTRAASVGERDKREKSQISQRQLSLSLELGELGAGQGFKQKGIENVKIAR
jgi:hypothetical protein